MQVQLRPTQNTETWQCRTDGRDAGERRVVGLEGRGAAHDRLSHDRREGLELGIPRFAVAGPHRVAVLETLPAGS